MSAVLCLDHAYYRNPDFLAPYFADRGVKFWSLPPPPEKHGSVEEDVRRLGEWYEKMETGEGRAMVEWLDEEHHQRVAGVDQMAEQALDKFWWPFTQHGLVRCGEELWH